METVVLGRGDIQSKEKNQDILSSKQNIPAAKRDFSTITNAAVTLAERLCASAIITFSEDISKISTNIPVFTFRGRKSAMMNELTRYIEETDKNIYEKMEDRARRVAEEISDASVIAFINTLIETERL